MRRIGYLAHFALLAALWSGCGVSGKIPEGGVRRGTVIEYKISGREVYFDLKVETGSGEIFYGKIDDSRKDRRIKTAFDIFDDKGTYVGWGNIDMDGYSHVRAGDNAYRNTKVTEGKFGFKDKTPPGIKIKDEADHTFHPFLRLETECGLKRIEVRGDVSREDKIPVTGEVTVLTDQKTNPSIEIDLEDHAGNVTTVKRTFTRRGRSTKNVDYHGISGEVVHEKFGSQIENAIERLRRKYGIYTKCFVDDAPEVVFGQGMGVELSSGCFLYQGKDTLGLGLQVLTHEFGHNVYVSIFGARRIDKDFAELYKRSNDLGIISTFKDSNFIEYPEAGHPEDSSTELFASAFAINELCREEYKTRFFPGFTKEQKELAEAILNFVDRTRKK